MRGCELQMDMENMLKLLSENLTISFMELFDADESNAKARMVGTAIQNAINRTLQELGGK